MRRAHGGLRGPRPAPAVGSVSRRPGEDALQQVALQAIDDSQAYALGGADLPEPWHGTTLFAQEPQHAEIQSEFVYVSLKLVANLGHRGAAFGTAVASKVYRRRPDAAETGQFKDPVNAAEVELASVGRTLGSQSWQLLAHNSA